MENFKQRIYKELIITKTVGSITINNIEDIYKQNYKRYLYLNSDEVEVNGKLVSDKFQRQLLMFPNENGETNIKTASANWSSPLLIGLFTFD